MKKCYKYFFSKILKNKFQKIFSSDLKKIVHTFQMIIRIFFLMLEKFLNIFLVKIFFFIFFMSGELRPPASPTRSAPLDPACFWIEDSSRNRFALNGISAVSPTRFFKHFFLNKKKFLKSFATYAQFFFKSDKKKMLKKKIATTFFFQHLKKSSNIFFRPKIV